MIKTLNKESFVKLKTFLKKIVKFRKFKIIFSLFLISILIIGSILLWTKISTPQKTFNLNDENFTYQITKCWKTTPPSYWIKQFKTGENKSIKIGKCTFQGTGAIKLKQGNIDFSKFLNRDIIAQGKLIKEKGKYYYLLTSLKLKTSNPIDPTLKLKENLIIKRITPKGEEIIYKAPKYSDHRILKWQNYLFFGNLYKNSTNEKLVRYNLDTNKTEVVYREDSTRKFLRYLNSIQVIDNTLFFTVSGYLTGSDLFWLDSPTANPQKSQFGGNRIDFEHGKYWIKGGEGDGCWSIESYDILNPKNKVITPITNSYKGCAEGEEYIDIDSKDRMIMAYHKTKKDSRYDEQIYKYVVAIPLNSPKSKQFLITKEFMPDGIRRIKYSPESNQLALAGNDYLYLFSPLSLKLKKIASFSNEWIYIKIYNWINNQLCLSNDIGKKETYLVNLSNGTTKKDSSYCDKDIEWEKQEHLTYEEEGDRKVRDLISKLDLPSNYKIVVEANP